MNESENKRLEPTRWVHPNSDQVSILREAEPGIYYVSAELLHRMMRELGWHLETDDHETSEP